MKSSHYRTPRTLADAEFIVGHREACPAPARASIADMALFGAACVLLGLLIAWSL